jgi:hypothetical protein
VTGSNRRPSRCKLGVALTTLAFLAHYQPHFANLCRFRSRFVARSGTQVHIGRQRDWFSRAALTQAKKPLMPKWHYNEETETFHGDALYFIQEGEDGPIKIGRGDPQGRLKGLQTGNPRVLRIRAHVPNEGYTEIFWHAVFADARIRGEWFEPRPELCAAIKWVEKGEDWADEALAPDGLCQYHYSQLMLDAYDIFSDLVLTCDKHPPHAVKFAMETVSSNLTGLSHCPPQGCDPDEMHNAKQAALNRYVQLCS